MILLGSEAARRRNCLPDWRGDAPIRDIDMIGTPAEFEALCEHFRAAGKTVLAHDRGAGWFGARITDKPGAAERILIDFMPASLASSQLIDALDDHETQDFHGLEVRVVSEAVQYVTKLAYDRFPIEREKNDADLAFWFDRMSEGVFTVTRQHMDIYRAVLAEYLERAA